MYGSASSGSERETERVIRFQFILDPIETIRPWTDGNGDNPALHWFGLTLGEYWIVIDEFELFRIDDATMMRLTDDGFSPRRYADYQVVRLWEDLLKGSTRFLEPVPADLTEFVRIEDGLLPKWDYRSDPDEDAARFWREEHSLDSGHMVLPRVKWWRTLSAQSDVVWTAWQYDTQDRWIQFDAPDAGLIATPTDDFVAAIVDFDARLIAAMAERVEAVADGALAANIHCDVDGLRQQHAGRAKHLNASLNRSLETDWSQIRRGAQRLMSRARTIAS